MGNVFQQDMDEYLPLRDVVFKTLRQGILTGELKPGERLMEIHLANKLGVTVDQLLCDYYDDPTAVYLREIAKRIDGYEVSQRILVCESLENYLNTLERFAKK